VLLVKRLRNLQGAFSRKTEAAIRFALQCSQIIKARRDLRTGFFLLTNIGDRISPTRVRDCFRGGLIPNAIRAVVLVVILFKIGTLIDAFVFAPFDFESRRAGGDS